MTYALGRDERIPDALRRVAREELDGALHVLATAEVDAAVHAIRKHLKRLRALVRLARSGLGRERARAANRGFRDAARTLSDARDSRVMIDGTRALAAATRGAQAEALFRLVEALEERHRGVQARLASPEGPLVGLAETLEGLRGTVSRWTVDGVGFAVLAPGLQRTYARGAHALGQARAEPTGERLHDWRKRVKDLWYHLSLLLDLWPAGLAPLVEALELLSDRLGLDHDHAILDDALSARPGLVSDPAERALIDAAIDGARSRLQADVWSVGERVWAESPAAFTRRIEGYWVAWRPDAARGR